MLTERKTKSGLVIVGDLIDVEKYMSIRGVVNGVDPSTGMRVEYGGKKRIGAGKSSFGDSWESNPYIRYGDEFRMAGGVIRSVNGEKAINPDQKLEIAGVANANVIDRMDERLEPAGCDTGHFIKNNILLADHMYYSDFAIGLVNSMDAKDSGVEFQAHIGDPSVAPLTERQRNIRSLVAQKILKTVSVGFIPHKIRAPEFDQNGAIVEPAVILMWEMLELSIVAIPCNPGATFEQRYIANEHRKKIFQIGVSLNASNDAALTTSKNASENSVKQSDEKTSTQTIIFSKEKFTQAEAVKWANEHEYRSDKIDETETSFRMRQKEPDEFVDGSFRTIDLTDGIQAVIGRLKTTEETGVDGMDKETAQALIDQMKAVATAINGLVDGTKSNGEKLDAIAAKLDAKPVEKPEETPAETESETEKRIIAVETALKAATDSIAKMDDVMGKILEKLCATAA